MDAQKPHLACTQLEDFGLIGQESKHRRHAKQGRRRIFTRNDVPIYNGCANQRLPPQAIYGESAQLRHGVDIRATTDSSFRLENPLAAISLSTIPSIPI